MQVKHILKSSGLTALAAGIMAVALPAVALADPGEGHGHERRSQGRSEDNDGSEQRGNGNGGGEARVNWNGGNRGAGAPAIARPAPAQVRPAEIRQVQTQPQAEPRRSWNGGERGGNWQARSNWRDNPAPQSAPIQAQSNWRSSDRGGPAEAGRNREGRAENWHGEPQRNENWRGGSGWQNDHRSNWRAGDARNWNRGWREDNRYNWRGWRDSHRDVFRLSRYYPPYRGWGYRRLGIGFFLNTLFFSSNYWIDNPWMYRLPEAYGPYRWVRYYDDALLVNIYSGEVVDVIYDVFW